MRVRVSALLLLAGLAALAVGSIAPPAVVSESAAVELFSAARARIQLERIAARPHPVGSQAHGAVRAHIVQRLQQLGIDVRIASATSCTSQVFWTHCAKVQNVIGTIPGRASASAILLAAHYDSVPESPGAADAGAGVVALLETARALRAGAALEQSVLLLFTDAEEDGMLGAAAFVDSDPSFANVRVMLNFEARGSHGPSALFETSPDNGALIEAFAKASPYPVGNSFVSTLARMLPNDTDATIFRARHTPLLNFAFADGLQHYHHASDSIHTIDYRSAQHHGEYALALTRELASRPLAKPRAPDLVFFDVLGRFVVRYPLSAARWLGLLSAAAFVLLWMHARRKLGATSAGLWRAARSTILAGLAAAGVALLLHIVLAQLMPPIALVAQAKALSLACIAAALVPWLWMLSRRSRDTDEIDVAVSSLLPLAIIGVTLSWLAPGMSYVFVWPLAFGAVSLFAARELSAPWAHDVVLALGAIPGVVIGAIATYTLVVLVGGELPVIVVLFFVAFSAAWVPLLAGVPARALRHASGVAAAIGLVCSAWVVVRAGDHSARAWAATPLVYAADAASRRGTFYRNAAQLSGQPEAPEYKVGPVAFASFLREPVLQRQAPFIDLPPSYIERKNESREGAQRQIALHVHPALGARCVWLWNETGRRIVTRSVDQSRVRALPRFSPEWDKRLWRLGRAAPSGDPWNLRYCAVPAEGFELVIEVEGDGPVDLRVVTEWDELVPGLPLAELRNTLLQAAPAANVTLLSQKLAL